MWRLKIGEGSNDPCLFSTNNFTGRQTWVFDPEAGTPEERAEVEEARQNFYKNRHQVKASSDLLWRMQFLREKNFKQTIPPVNIEDGEEITYEKATTALRRAISFFAALQSSDGHWPAENDGPMFFLPPFNEDGGWGLHIEGHSIMFCTALSYICMRILGEGPDGGKDNACARAQKWILDHGSVTHIPSWGKSWLSEDLYYPHPWIQDMLWDSLYILTEPLLTRWPFNKLVREKALQVTMKHIHYEDEISRYITIGVVEKAICMLACWVEDPNGDYFKKHLARVKEFIWIAEDGIKMHSFGSQLWDTSFTIQALLASDLINEIGPVLARGHDFIKKSQVRDNPSGDFKSMYRHISKGSWTFSDQDHGLQVSDCTAHSLKCCLLFSTMPSEVVGEKMELERLFDSVNILLSLQSKNGGLPAWEPARAGDWLDVKFLEDIVVEHEYVECTASTIQALVLFKKLHPGHRMEEIDGSIRNGISYIENTQLPDGSWYGSWGICFIYGTWFALCGLAAVGS
ncbi:beta-amyrin synthase [Quercus suber]|uniref:Beta-amyrin synthase n=1 Tax=Quercus suber TaxID=58331 RepID=A0AAW0JD68_QUESU